MGVAGPGPGTFRSTMVRPRPTWSIPGGLVRRQVRSPWKGRRAGGFPPSQRFSSGSLSSGEGARRAGCICHLPSGFPGAPLPQPGPARPRRTPRGEGPRVSQTQEAPAAPRGTGASSRGRDSPPRALAGTRAAEGGLLPRGLQSPTTCRATRPSKGRRGEKRKRTQERALGGPRGERGRLSRALARQCLADVAPGAPGFPAARTGRVLGPKRKEAGPARSPARQTRGRGPGTTPLWGSAAASLAHLPSALGHG